MRPHLLRNRGALTVLTVPIVVVFTKIDNQVAGENYKIMEREDEMENSGQLKPDGRMKLKARKLLALERANENFDTICGDSVRGVLQRLNERRKVGEQIIHDIPYTKVSGMVDFSVSCALILTHLRFQ